MRRINRRHLRLTVLLAIFLLSSLRGLAILPAWYWPGLDLQNLHAFHTNCGGGGVPYARTGAECGDVLGRPFIYPPLLYWAMAWLRGIEFSQAVSAWKVAIVGLVATGIGLAIFNDRLRPRFAQILPATALGSILFFLLPMRYSLERGNVDALVVFASGIGIALFASNRLFFSGMAFAISAALKVYPAIAVLLLVIALGLQRGVRERRFSTFLFGLVTGTGVVALATWPDFYRYVTEVLPAFSRERGAIQPYTHILYKSVWSWIFLKLPILGLWTGFTRRELDQDPMLVLTGGLAISTFFQNTSNDYNFITAYPFLFVLLTRWFRSEGRTTDFAILILTFLVFVGDRTVWIPLFGNRGVLYWQILWLFVFPIYAVKRIDKGNWPEGNLSLR